MLCSFTRLSKKLLICCWMLASAVPCANAQAKTARETVLYVFEGKGGRPWAGLISDNAGNLYGTTADTEWGRGIVYMLTPENVVTVLHTFPHKDGESPVFDLLADDLGNLYGTTTARNGNDSGIVFKLAPDGTETVLHTFKIGDPAGTYPSSGLIADSAGNLYGTTWWGGGTVFKLAPDGTATALFAFEDGSNPGSLIADDAGNLYGTTEYGGNPNCPFGGCGTVFKLAPDGTETVLHYFTGGKADGSNPVASLIADSAGNLYGTTSSGGPNNGGTVFKLAPDGTETVLLSFRKGKKGATPEASLIADNAGNLYGTTTFGGSTNCDNGCGTVFKLAPDGIETVLHYFKGVPGGANPTAHLLADGAGNLYGTTLHGGAGRHCGVDGCGTVFKLTLNTTR